MNSKRISGCTVGPNQIQPAEAWDEKQPYNQILNQQMISEVVTDHVGWAINGPQILSSEVQKLI